MARKRAKIELEQAGFADPLFLPEPPPSPAPTSSHVSGWGQQKVPRGVPQGVPGAGEGVEYIPFIQPQLIAADASVLQQAIDDVSQSEAGSGLGGVETGQEATSLPQVAVNAVDLQRLIDKTTLSEASSASGGVETGQEATPALNTAVLQKLIDKASRNEAGFTLTGVESGQEATPSLQQAAAETMVPAIAVSGQSEDPVTAVTGTPVADPNGLGGEGSGIDVSGGSAKQGENWGGKRREGIEKEDDENLAVVGETRGEGKDGAGLKEKGIGGSDEGLAQLPRIDGGEGETGALVLDENPSEGGKEEQNILGGKQDLRGEEQDTLGGANEAEGKGKEGAGEDDSGIIAKAVDEAAEETSQVRKVSRFRKVLEVAGLKVGGKATRGRLRGRGTRGEGGNRALSLVLKGENAADEHAIQNETPDQYRDPLGGAETVSKGAANGTTLFGGVNQTTGWTNTFLPMKTPSPSEMDELYLNQTVQNLLRQEEMRWSALKRAYPNNTFYQKPLNVSMTQLRRTAEIQLRNVRQQIEMQQRIREAKLEEERKFVATLAQVRNKTRGRGAAQPLIYVYELPPHLNTWTYVHSGAGADRTAPVIFLERLLHSPHRTTDPNLADYFFVPAWPRWHLNRGPYLESVVQYLNATWPFFAARGGSDHIWFTTDDWGPCEETGLRNRVIGAGVLLTFWGYDKNARNGGEDPCFIPGQDIVVPPNLEYNILAKRREAEERGRLTIGLKNRTNWFYFAGSSGRLAESTGTGRKEYSFGVRQVRVNES